MFRSPLITIITLSIALGATNVTAASLSGRVWESPGNKPVKGERITINGCGDQRIVTTSSSGSFRAQVVAGTCYLQLNAHDSPTIAIIVSGDSATANLELRESGGRWRLIRR